MMFVQPFAFIHIYNIHVYVYIYIYIYIYIYKDKRETSISIYIYVYHYYLKLYYIIRMLNETVTGRGKPDLNSVLLAPALATRAILGLRLDG